MRQQKTRINSTLADIKRRPKSHRQSTRFSKFHPFSNVNPYGATHIEYREQLTLNIENNSYPVSGATYTQYQLMPSIDSISFPIPEVAYT
ncbi:hypothetical protein F8M41_025108 [Gigaspora margarita]|uniref:Uncharacterized protein n=1 Tax=Gigaspora margarita TaxID=4874 RepID=A0A8H3XJP9_GIGMA|nr:hypothetical protein F8M41_025108 [Gigaspora margarita]